MYFYFGRQPKFELAGEMSLMADTPLSVISLSKHIIINTATYTYTKLQ